MTARIVVVEDDPSVAELVTLYLRNAGFIVVDVNESRLLSGGFRVDRRGR